MAICIMLYLYSCDTYKTVSSVSSILSAFAFIANFVFVCMCRNVYDKIIRIKWNCLFATLNHECGKWAQEMKKKVRINVKMAKKRNEFNWKYA